MSNKSLGLPMVITLTSCLFPQLVEGQATVGPRELAGELRQIVETQGGMYGVVPALVQFWGHHPADDLDALADTIVEVMVDYADRGFEEASAVQGMGFGVLTTAMIWDNPERGEPYLRAGERFVTLAYRMQGKQGDVASVTALAYRLDRGEALRYLRDFALSEYRTAEVAVGLLAQEDLMGPDGMAVLRELHDADLVSEPRARKRIQAVGRARGWR